MLGKLLKYDTLSTAKVFIPLDIFLIIMTIFMGLFYSIPLFKQDTMIPIWIFMSFLYGFSLLTVIVITIVYLIVYYYKNIFSAQGYLTFTLPTTPHQILLSKTIVGFFWMAFNSLLIFISLIFIDFMTNIYNINDATNYTTYYTIETFYMGYEPLPFLLWFILFGLAFCMFLVLSGYACIAIGQLYAKHKVAGSIIAYIVNYFIVSIASFTLFFMIFFIGGDNYQTEQQVLPLTTLMLIIFIVIYYSLISIIMEKRVNLD